MHPNIIPIGIDIMLKVVPSLKIILRNCLLVAPIAFIFPNSFILLTIDI